MGAVTAGVDWAAPGRVDTWSARLVDTFELREVGSVDLVPDGCTLTWAQDSTTLASAKLRISGDWQQGGVERMVRVLHHVEVAGVSVDEVLGTYFVDDLGRESLHRISTRDLDCYGCLYRLSEDLLADDYYEPAGAGALAACTRLVDYADDDVADGVLWRTGEGLDASATLAGDQVHQIGENRLATLRLVAGARGWQVGCDPEGHVTIEPWVAPLRRGVAYRFRDGANCTYVPGVKWGSTKASVYNRVVAYWSREQLPDPDDGLGLTQRCVVDLPAEAHMSFVRTGRRRTGVLKASEPCTRADLVDQATEWLAANCGDVTSIEIEHVQVPGLGVGDVVTYENSVDDPEPMGVTAEIVETSMRLGPMPTCTTKLRIVDWRLR